MTDLAALRKHCQQRAAAMKEAQTEWLSDWKDASDHVDPTRGRFGDADKPRKRSRRTGFTGTPSSFTTAAPTWASERLASWLFATHRSLATLIMSELLPISQTRTPLATSHPRRAGWSTAPAPHGRHLPPGHPARS